MENIVDEVITEFDVNAADYNGILITGAVMATDPELTENYKVLNASITSDKYSLLIYSPLATMKFKGSDEERYERAMRILHNSKVVIAEMSNVSTGQGMELQEATHLGLPILVLAKKGSKVSSLVKGCPNVVDILYYEDIYEVIDEINAFIDRELDLIHENDGVEAKLTK